MKKELLLAAAALPLLLSSCETTGDPNQGGLFGWSQSQADDRLDQRRATLSSLQSDTSRQRSRSSSMESQLR
jgi:hypothetical protein